MVNLKTDRFDFDDERDEAKQQAMSDELEEEAYLDGQDALDLEQRLEDALDDASLEFMPWE